EEAAARFQEADLPGEAAGCLFMQARRLPGSGKQVFDLDLAEQAMALSQESGDIRLEAIARKHLAIAYSNLGRDGEALPLAEESLETQWDLGDRHEQCSTIDVLGVVLARLGRREEAAAMLQRCLALSEEIGSDWGIAGAVFGLWYYWYVPDGEYESLVAFLDERLAHALANGRHWMVGFLGFLKTKSLISLGQYDEALALIRTTAIPAIAEEDLIS
ncbi:MAG: tetratricopeptide repeat protein, partial [Anaerolineae bacterium]|nr:tetratricopeptide repeat protein [Anaerolineae bacterium]